ncbi:hypothetical protein AVEN_205996-1 [Araneus ventricosus]|uniref:Uncharacterized protein n=1 Tax=Araneus ventricosus TaxID=182803 RepID=A0A4Y2GWM5_ARAVE|nr:hypothetical protein AVEN_205996-1 [Araneus ventricosus]
MDFPPEPKPINEKKSDEECSDNFIMNVLPASNENDEMPGFSAGNYDSESEHVENKMAEEKLYFGAVSNSIEHFDSEDQEKQTKMNVTKKCKTEDKNDGLLFNVNENEEKDILEVENDFMQQINPQEDVSSDSSYASSIETNSSGIEIDFEAHEDCAAENEGEINNNIFEDSSAKQFPDVESSNFTKDPSSKKENEVSENSSFEGKEQEKINLINNEDNILKEDKDVVSSDNSVSLFDSIKFPYKNPANCFDVVVPLIGKDVIAVGDIKPFNHRYDLAREINRLKGIEDAPYMPKLSYHEWRKQRDARPQEEKDREERHEKFIAVKTAAYIIKTAAIILKEMQNDNPDEGIIERCFIRFLKAPVSPLSLLLSSQFVHVMMYIRGSSDFSDRLRYIADKCYMRCHIMFPIPDGYNFVTVYSSEVVKNIPDQLNGMRNFILDYGDFEYPVSESDDSAFSDDNEDEVI